MKTDFKRLRTFKDIHDRFLRYKKKYIEAFIREIDYLRVPKINFNIENYFENIEKSRISFLNDIDYYFKMVYQKNYYISKI